MCDRTHLVKKREKKMDYKEVIRDYGIETYYSLLLPAIRGLEYNRRGDDDTGPQYVYDESKAATVQATIAVIETLFEMVERGSDTSATPTA
jgi:hypothetical protein